MAGGKGMSTDKLLDLIRKKGGKPAEAPSSSSAETTPPPGAKDAPAAGKSVGKQQSPGAEKKQKPKVSLPKLGGLGKQSVLSGFKKSGLSLGRGGGGASGVVVGVDFGPDSLRLAKTAGTSGRRKLVAFRCIPYDPNIPSNSSEFAGFLRSKLKEFCKGDSSFQLWSLISSAKAELWNIRIPKVPRRQIMDAVFWSVKKEKQFDEAEFVLDFDVLGEVSDKGVPKLAVTVYLAPRNQVEEVQNLFSKAGYKLSGITIAPIAIQTLFRSGWIQTTAGTYANLYVGRNWSRIDIFNKGNLVLSRGIKAGTNSMVEALVDSYNLKKGNQSRGASPGGGSASPEEPVISMSLDDEEAAVVLLEDLESARTAGRDIDFNQARRVLFAKLLGMGSAAGDPGEELDEAEVADMILPAAERLVRQIERTFEYHSTTMGNEPVEQIFFSSPICTNRLMMQYMYQQLGIECLILDPLNPENSHLGKLPVPGSVVDRLEYNLVMAVALSSSTITPNLLFTFRDKERQRQSEMLDKLVYAITIAVLLVLSGVWMWQNSVISKSEELKRKNEVALKKYTPKADEALLMGMAEKVNEMNRELKRASLRYEGLAALSDLSFLTPDNIKLLSIDMEFGPYVDLFESTGAKGGATGTKKSASKTPARPVGAAKESPKYLLVDGFIEGAEQEQFNADFSRYIIRLENSPMFDMPSIVKQADEEFGNKGRVMRFTIKVPLTSGA